MGLFIGTLSTRGAKVFGIQLEKNGFNVNQEWIFMSDQAKEAVAQLEQGKPLYTCSICHGMKVIEINGGDTIACPGCKGKGYR
jgi:DNA-directed RNA polymerase subunit RPC12/RpoP